MGLEVYGLEVQGLEKVYAKGTLGEILSNRGRGRIFLDGWQKEYIVDADGSPINNLHEDDTAIFGLLRVCLLFNCSEFFGLQVFALT